ncbi:vegetative incompatibility WD repeat protein [Penicillium malachiteum]|uniref:Vegetative incompatibility WD repeat protein n=1 Tax=Penicillium malachiteum TaxID=1324776 RepID=A0AAD6MS21_9EURO|nr:vegetative incompatibility WD repeat protein [Penicillium malachiteum]
MTAESNTQGLPSLHKRGGADWHADFNPDVQRVLDVDLIYHLKHDSVISCVRFSEDGKYLATGGNGLAKIFDMTTGSNVASFQHGDLNENESCYIRSVCFSHNGEYLVTRADDKLIRIWDIASCAIKNNFDSHDEGIFSLDISRDGQFIVSGGADKTVNLGDISSDKLVHKLHSEDIVATVSISPDGHYIAAGLLYKSICIWDTITGDLVDQLESPGGHHDRVYSVAFAHNSHDLVSGSLDKTIKLWELAAPRGVDAHSRSAEEKCVRTFKGHEDLVLSICLTPDNQWIISGSKDCSARFGDPETGNVQMILFGHQNSVIAVAAGATSNIFATGSGDMSVRVWRYSNLGEL